MPKIGLEIHGYLVTNEKLFCSCKALHGSKNSKPNTNICPICTGQPGAKPLLPNKTAINNAIKIGLLLNCNINQRLVWQRKHYDWPDLPKGYQNTISGTYAIPNATKGEFEEIRITELHLEEDPAAWNPKTGEIDYNRSGTPLIEIVTEPDFKSSEQVIEWIKKLLTTLGYIDVINKKAGIKADVNISLPENKGERVEIKNVNSIKNIKKAIEYEIKRQSSSKEEIPKIQETRMFDETKGITKLMRTKEQAQDYRFIAEPDLPTLKINKERINKLKKDIPETPKQKLDKLINQYKLDKKAAEILTKRLEIVEFFEKIIENKKIDKKIATQWVLVELLSVLNYNQKELSDIDLKSEHFIELLELLQDKKITELKAKDLLRSWKEKSYSPKEKAKDFGKISENEIKELTKKVIQENPKAVSDYKAGQEKSINFLIGQIMRLSEKRADFKTSKENLEEELKRIVYKDK